MRARFAALRIRPANRELRAAAHRSGGQLDVRWLLAECPEDADAPADYWLSSLRADTAPATLVRLAKLRWRIEHDYRELKDGPGLDHFEGRSFRGWHHHVTCVSVAHAVLTLHDYARNQGGSLTLYGLLAQLQRLIACWHDHCPPANADCHQPTHPLQTHGAVLDA